MTSFELHLIRPARAQFGRVPLHAREGHEGLDLCGQLAAGVVATVRQDDASAVRRYTSS